MRILLLAPDYLGLYKPIAKELRLQGHDVKVVADKTFLQEDWNFPWLGIRDRLFRRLKHDMFSHHFRDYWEKLFAHDEALNEPYDLLFCINGCSLHRSFFEHIKATSPHIRKVLYIWDDSQFYGYFQYARYFDKIATFDWADSIRNKVRFLPFYWMPSKNDMPANCKYDMSMIGTNHSDRARIASLVASQLLGGVKVGVSKLSIRLCPNQTLLLTHQFR